MPEIRSMLIYSVYVTYTGSMLHIRALCYMYSVYVTYTGSMLYIYSVYVNILGLCYIYALYVNIRALCYICGVFYIYNAYITSYVF